MARKLKFELPSQSEITREGSLPPNQARVAVGRRRVEFYIPKCEFDLQTGQQQTQKLVEDINQFINNIADDYFMLGLHLIALHGLLRNSCLNNDQVKAWYAENINMPYSSAMQCKKVAETYADHPELINRYTASGAYLLTVFETSEQRQAVWEKAKGDKDAPSIRELRQAIKAEKDCESLSKPAPVLETTQVESRDERVREQVEALSTLTHTFLASHNPDEKEISRKRLLKMIHDLSRLLKE